jgi:hypothetical protein
VPSRDSRTGDVAAAFREAFEARRSRGLRPDVDAADWHGFYRLAVNTTLSSEGGTLAVGQPVTSYRERK